MTRATDKKGRDREEQSANLSEKSPRDTGRATERTIVEGKGGTGRL